jgi:hypothetical protein
VLLAALKLLEARSGPVLEDYPEDVPSSHDIPTTLACPVNFTQTEVNLSEMEQLCTVFRREFISLKPWYDMAVKKQERTTVGISGIALDDVIDFLCSFLEGRMPENPRTDISLPYTLNLAVNDLKAYYYEAITAQPGQEAVSSLILAKWFWYETVAGQVLFTIREVSKKSEDVLMKIVGTALIVPTSVRH